MKDIVKKIVKKYDEWSAGMNEDELYDRTYEFVGELPRNEAMILMMWLSLEFGKELNENKNY